MQQEMQQYSEMKKSQAKVLKESRSPNPKMNLEDATLDSPQVSPIKSEKRKKSASVIHNNRVKQSTTEIIESNDNDDNNDFVKKRGKKRKI